MFALCLESFLPFFYRNRITFVYLVSAGASLMLDTISWLVETLFFAKVRLLNMFIYLLIYFRDSFDMKFSVSNSKCNQSKQNYLCNNYLN